MPFETVTLNVSGRTLQHTSCTLSSGAEEAARTASFVIAWNERSLPCLSDEEATIKISGELWGSGVIRDVLPSHDEENHDVTVTFISRTADLSEASVDHPTGLVENADVMEVAKALDTTGVGITGDAVTPKKRVHKVRLGETLLDSIREDMMASGTLLHDDENGRAVLTQKPSGRHAGALRYGDNIKSGSAKLSGATSFAKVKGRGQRTEGTAGPSLQPESEIAGSDRARGRALIVVQHGEATEDRLTKRVETEARRKAGNGTTASIVTPGWRDEAGRLWARNFLVEVDNPTLGLEQDMVIANVSLQQDESGTIATLSLKDPRALGGDNPRGGSSPAWSASVTTPTFRVGASG